MGPESYQASLQGQSEQGSICGLKRANPGSAGLDLHASSYIVLIHKMGPQTLSIGVFCLLKEGIFGLILHRSRSTMKGLQVFPGVIDQGYKGEIKIMSTATKGIITINAGQRVAVIPVVFTTLRT